MWVRLRMRARVGFYFSLYLIFVCSAQNSSENPTFTHSRPFQHARFDKCYECEIKFKLIQCAFWRYLSFSLLGSLKSSRNSPSMIEINWSFLLNFQMASFLEINGRSFCFIFNLKINELAFDWFGTSRRFNFKHSTQSNIKWNLELDLAHSIKQIQGYVFVGPEFNANAT